MYYLATVFAYLNVYAVLYGLHNDWPIWIVALNTTAALVSAGTAVRGLGD